MTVAPWLLATPEAHNYPTGVKVQGNVCTMLGDGMNLLTRQVTGDCTLVGHLADLTRSVSAPDGMTPDGSWRAGLILRGTTNTTLGQPLGDGGATRFTALFGSVGGGTYFEDDTMRAGNGDANAWSSNLGGGYRWFKLQRLGDTFTSYISADGATWTAVKTNTLAGMGTTLYAGMFLHALPSQNPNLHWASFDSLSLIGNVIGPATVAVTPATATVYSGQSARFSSTVVGAAPFSYQWSCNGVGLEGATNASLALTNLQPANSGLYSVAVTTANGVAVSGAATVTVQTPSGGVLALLTNSPVAYWRLNESSAPRPTTPPGAIMRLRKAAWRLARPAWELRCLRGSRRATWRSNAIAQIQTWRFRPSG